MDVWYLILSLFLAPLTVSLMYFAIRRLFEKRSVDADIKDKEIKRLLGMLEQQKAEDLLEWKEEVNASFCAIKTDTKAISAALHDRVVYEHCNDRMDKLDTRIRVLGG
jgi:hypothetical protein